MSCPLQTHCMPHCACFPTCVPLVAMENAVDRAIRWLALAAGLVSLVVYFLFYVL